MTCSSAAARAERARRAPGLVVRVPDDAHFGQPIHPCPFVVAGGGGGGAWLVPLSAAAVAAPSNGATTAMATAPTTAAKRAETREMRKADMTNPPLVFARTHSEFDCAYHEDFSSDPFKRRSFVFPE